MEKIVLFGTGAGAKKVMHILKEIGVQISYLTDNNSEKWGQVIEGIEVIAPSKLQEIECKIMIASVYQEEIEEQLCQMGLLKNLVIREKYIMEYFEKKIQDIKEKEIKNKKIIKIGQTIIFDMLECVEYGGIERWTYCVVNELRKKGVGVQIIGDPSKILPPENLIDCITDFDIDYEKIVESVEFLIRYFEKYLPCSIVINRQGIPLMVAILLKRLHPDMVKVLSVSHSDQIWLYRRIEYLKNDIDAVVCVSDYLKERLKNEFGVNENIIYHCVSPIEYKKKYRQIFFDNTKPINICFVGRITKAQKRADLLINFIELMNETNIKFQLNIAGIGDFFPKLQEHVESKELKNVKLFGLLSEEEMDVFWKNQDIFIRTSDYEGIGLSMLEAMSFGIVPVVTKVGSEKDVIVNEKNGFVVNKGDILHMVEIITHLYDDIGLLKKISYNAQKTIFEKCDKEKYADYIAKICEIKG